MSVYIPDQGHLVWLTFTPQAGHEQAGRRPALVLSPHAYNGRVGLALFCPVTNQIKGYPFEVRLPDGLGITGAILSDQVKSLDWRARNVAFSGVLPVATLQDVLRKIHTLLPLPSGA